MAAVAAASPPPNGRVAQGYLRGSKGQSYRDAYRLLLPFASQFVSKPVDRLTVEDLSVECLTGFLESLEKDRGCGVRTRNQRLAAISSLDPFTAPREVHLRCRLFVCLARLAHIGHPLHASPS